MTSTLSNYHREAPHNEAARLQEENTQLKAELQREHEMYIRNLADFANYHRRTERDRTQAVQAGKRDLLLGVVSVLDDFERALAYSQSEPQTIIEGVQAIYRRLAGLLATHGVTAFESVGQRFDPTRHEASEVVARPGIESGIILNELQRGYCWGKELLRPAQVNVAQ